MLKYVASSLVIISIKYGRVAEQNNLRFIPAVFSYTGQIHGEFKALIKEQIRQKLIAFEGEAKSSKIRSVMKWWSKRISMAIAKTASRNVDWLLKWLK